MFSGRSQILCDGNPAIGPIQRAGPNLIWGESRMEVEGERRLDMGFLDIPIFEQSGRGAIGRQTQ